MTVAIGKPMDRVDGRLKVTGQALFAAEYPFEEVVHACIVTSTIAKGRITQIHAGAAEDGPGVIAVLTHENAPAMKTTEVFDPSADSPRSAGTSAAILQTDRVYWHGQPIAVVVAETLEQARYAAGLVRTEYEELPATVSLREAEKSAFAPENILGEPTEIRRGDAEKALAQAPVRVDNVYTTPRLNHNPIEPHATTALWEDDRLTVYDASQYIFGVRQMLAEKFGLPEKNVRVLSPYVGGGFGSKGLAWPHVALCVAAVRTVGRPVKLALTRAQMYACVGYRSPTHQRVALGADKNGRLTALVHTGISQTSTTNRFTEMFSFPARHLYACPNVWLGQKLVELDVAPPTFMRAPGETTGTFALESAIDELAHAAGIDPVELRARNEPENDPATGLPFSSRHIKEAFALGAEKFGWRRRNPEPRSMREGRILIGMGVAAAFYPYYRFPAAARVRIHADGTALIQCGAQEMGMGTATVHTLLGAELLGLSPCKVRTEHGDTNLPFAAVAGGSTTTVSAGSAIESACNALKAKLIELARKGSGPLCAVEPQEIAFENEGLFSKNDRARGETYRALLARHQQASVDARADARPGNESERFAMQSYGAQFCEVRVDSDLDEVRISRFVGVFDAGRIISAKTARSQFMGGITMGIGMALMEATRVDERTGRVVNDNLADYLLPVNADVPAIEVYWLDKPDPHAPLGAHGIGEIGITGVAAAVANAVFHATGRRVRDLPIRVEQLL